MRPATSACSTLVPGCGDPCRAEATEVHNRPNFLTKVENFDINDQSRFELESNVMWLSGSPVLSRGGRVVRSGCRWSEEQEE